MPRERGRHWASATRALGGRAGLPSIPTRRGRPAPRAYGPGPGREAAAQAYWIMAACLNTRAQVREPGVPAGFPPAGEDFFAEEVLWLLHVCAAYTRADPAIARSVPEDSHTSARRPDFAIPAITGVIHDHTRRPREGHCIRRCHRQGRAGQGAHRQPGLQGAVEPARRPLGGG
ncbi:MULTISPECIES: DUF6545 domain-containing protein [unclassified Streptomyces]|uniref:DUF6545 domain-containing protein n=1 Tax=unclassified Streptomyces TaxID=2593676 RepID=UPI003BA8CAD9